MVAGVLPWRSPLIYRAIESAGGDSNSSRRFFEDAPSLPPSPSPVQRGTAFPSPALLEPDSLETIDSAVPRGPG